MHQFVDFDQELYIDCDTGESSTDFVDMYEGEEGVDDLPIHPVFLEDVLNEVKKCSHI